MQKIGIHALGILALLALVVFGCEQEDNFSPLSEAGLDVAPVITYNSNVIPDNYIVVLKDSKRRIATSGLEFTKAQSTVTTLAVDKLAAIDVAAANLGQVYSKAIVGFSARLSPTELEQLRHDPEVAYIEQDQIITVAMGPPGSGGGDGGGGAQTTPYGIDRVRGGATYTGNGRAFIIDSGIDLDHPDLNVDVGASAYYVGRNADDQNGHGTHVAGTVAAIDNSTGVIGVAAGAPVVAVRVLDRRGSGSNSGVIAGVNYVAGVANQNDVANMSLGGGISTALDDAVIAASSSCPFVLAAGNSNADANTSSPARANGPNVYTISAMDANDVMASFSNFGSPVDYAAPGVGVQSTYKGGGYASLSGTSMAAPHAAGVLLWGNPATDGFVKNDKDNDPDPIIVVN